VTLEDLGRKGRRRLECKGAPSELKLDITVLTKSAANFVLPGFEKQMRDTGKLEPTT
jgi:hypothetical protein